jgi:hypothetical protein
MARRENPETQGTRQGSVNERPLCGIIMPISATQSHPEQHWRDVQILLHRAIESAGFEARNVWESALTDRVSERIIGNIFLMPIVVADISDLNPNVMLELGLRLSSKKPTIVVLNDGGTIPFDIRDFHAIFYPPDLNILGMEDFFKKLTRAIKDKYAASQKDNYVPFLGAVIVDVASPETREVGANQIILDRLDSLATEIRRIDRARSSTPAPSPQGGRIGGEVGFTIPEASFDAFYSEAASLYEVDGITTDETESGVTKGIIHFSGAMSFHDFYSKIEKLLDTYGGEFPAPF